MFFLLFIAFASAAQQKDYVVLQNAAQPNQRMPWIGLGTGAYSVEATPYGAYPECMDDIYGCGNNTRQAVLTWLTNGGRRLDTANSYNSQIEVGQAMRLSGVPRSDIFVLQKTGSANAMGYQDTLVQMTQILQDMKLTYVDLLLQHWPTSSMTPTVDVTCDPALNKTYDAKACRLRTWRAYVEIYRSGVAKSIGVSNYNSSHLQEIIDAGMPLPSVNQIPFHLYTAAAQQTTLAFCQKHNIVVLAYSPFGIPDWKVFPTGPGMLPATTPLLDPVLASITAKHVGGGGGNP